MYRQSAASSITPASQHSHLLQLLSDCVRETESCSHHAQSCIDALQPGVQDLPRFSIVLQSQRRYLFVPEPVIESHKLRLGSEIEPQIEELMARADKGLGSMERRVVALKRKLALVHSQQQVALPSTTAPRRQPPAARVTAPSAAEERKLAMMRGRKEKLRQELAELEVDAWSD